PWTARFGSDYRPLAGRGVPQPGFMARLMWRKVVEPVVLAAPTFCTAGDQYRAVWQNGRIMLTPRLVHVRRSAPGGIGRCQVDNFRGSSRNVTTWIVAAADVDDFADIIH